MSNSPINSDTYVATIPASFVDAETIEYYIYASDGVNSGTHPAGAPGSSPHSVDVNLYPDPVTVNVPTSEAITETTVELSWSESNATDFDNYSVFVSNTQEVLGETRETLTERSQTSYTVEELSPGIDWFAIHIRLQCTPALAIPWSAKLSISRNGERLQLCFEHGHEFTDLCEEIVKAAKGVFGAFSVRMEGQQ